MKKYLYTIVALLSVCYSHAQQRVTVSGIIKDGSTGETLIGANVLIKENPGTGTSCNEYGFYSLSLPAGDYILQIRFIGYRTLEKSIALTDNMRLDFQLVSDSHELEEIVVRSENENQNITTSNIGVEKLEVKEIRKIPVLFGEQDILKILRLTPGVKSLGEGNGGLYVRGGDNSQNLILLDEATVYNANHLLGFFSTFNSEAIKDFTLYKGTAPSKYGGRLSSVLDVKMNEGNNQDFHIGGGIGTISSRLNMEGPIVKNKGSFLLTARRTYADLFLRLSPDEAVNNNELYFYDLNLKSNFSINENNRVFLSGYFGRDVISIQDRFGIDWGNATGTLRWNHIWSDKLFSNTSLIYSDYDYRINVNQDVDDFSLTSVIKNTSLKQDFQLYLDDKNTFDFGLISTYHTITPGQLEVTEGSDINPPPLQKRYAFENTLYASHAWQPVTHLSLEYGLRLNSFSLMGPGDFYSYDANGDVTDTVDIGSNKTAKNYLNLEPRLNVAYVINESNSLKLSYTRNTQNLHLVTNSTSSNPTDIWIASSNNVKPEISDQVSLGYFKNFSNNTFQFSTEVYYKEMRNQLDLKNGAEIRANEHIEGELLFGSGKAYGMEMLLKKKQGKLSGWIGYTLSRTERKIDGINDFKWYPARQDATHDVSVVGIYDISKEWSLSATWVYTTGNAVTFPSGKYEIDGVVQYYYTDRNGDRMPDYHRLDLGATWYIKKSTKFESSLNFSIYNAYGRKNAYTIDFETDPNDPSRTQAVKTYLFTYMPSITYNFKF